LARATGLAHESPIGQFGARVKFRKEVNMLNKIILAVALVALMVPTMFAGPTYLGNTASDPYSVDWERSDGSNSTGPFEVKGENYNWPVSYDYVTAATIRVRMEVGFWIKLETKDKWLTLKQVEIHSYAGNVTITVWTNINIMVQASFSKNSGMPDMEVETMDLNGTGDQTQINAPGIADNLKISLKLKNVNLSQFSIDKVGTCLEIGKVTLKVKPLVRPNVTGAC
jgi:hypothetical protein